MKRLFAFILCLMLLIAPLSASAEEANESVAEGENVGDVVVDTPDGEDPQEGENLGAGEDATTNESPANEGENKHDWEELKDTVTSKIEAWIFENYDKALVTLFLIMSALYDRVRDKRNRKDIGTLNNNAISIAQSSSNFMGSALSEMKTASGAVIQYDSRIGELLEEYKQTAEDKARLEAIIIKAEKYLEIAADANIEFSNELAELLGLSNIPNYKKETIGSAHLERVKAILEAKKKADAAVATLPACTEEVKSDDGEEKKD